MFKWKYDPYLEVWEKGSLRVSSRLAEQIDQRAIVQHRSIGAVRKLAANIIRKRRRLPPPLLTGAAKARILKRIREEGRLRV